MGKSENKKPKTPPSPTEKALPSSATTDQNESAQKKTLPNANLRVETSNIGTPQPSQNTGSQRMHPAAAASIMSNSTTPMTTTTATPMTNTNRHYSRNTNNGPRKTELPTDSRPERTQRPEDLRRAQYLVNSSSHSNVPKITDENGKFKQSKRSPKNCWTTTSWILTWWAPPFMLKTFGKPISHH